MELREVAEQLIKTLDGTVSDKNIEGVLSVFDGIRLGCDNKWEDYLMKNISDLLIYSRTSCEVCGEPVVIRRTRQSVSVKPV